MATTGVWGLCPHSPVRSRAELLVRGSGEQSQNFCVYMQLNFKLKYAEIQKEPTHESHFCAKINIFWAGCGGPRPPPHPSFPRTACGPKAVCCAPLYYGKGVRWPKNEYLLMHGRRKAKLI